MKLLRLLLIPVLLALCWAGFALAEGSEVVYEGTIGDLPVTLSLGTSEAWYYYNKIGKSVELEEFPDKPGCYLESEPSHPHFVEDFDPASDNWWEITIKDTSIRGTWRSGNRKLPISLEKSASGDYEAHRLSIPFKSFRVTDINGIKIENLRHPVTGVEISRVAEGIPAEIANIINEDLSKEGDSLNSMWVECSDWEGRIQQVYVTRTWMVFDAGSAGFCGGFHPNEYSYPLSYDSSSGKRIDFGEWIASDYRDVFNSIQGELQELLAKTFEYDECREHVAANDWKQFTPWMSGTEFSFRLDIYDRAYVSCEGDYSISFEDMRKFIAPGHLPEYDRFVAAAREKRSVATP